MWSLEVTNEFEKKKVKWPKKHSRELAAVTDNLNKLFLALNSGSTLESVQTFGFVHSEPKGVLAVDQKGGHGAGLKETRLYVYPDKDTQIVHVIILGDKNSQKVDIKYCGEYVQRLQKWEE